MAFVDDDDNFEDLDRGDLADDQEDENQEEQEDEDNQEEQEDEDQEISEEDDDLEDQLNEEEEEKPSKQIPPIPKGRLDKALRQRDEWKDRSLWLEEQLEKMINLQSTTSTKKEEAPAEPEYDFENAENEYANFLIQGEVDKAAKLRREIDKQRDQSIRRLIEGIKTSAVEEAKQKSSETVEDQKFQVLVSNFENKYPFLNAEGDDYNEEAVDTVNTLMSGYMAKGLSKSEALRKAVDKVAPMYKTEQPSKKQKSLGQARKEEAGRKAAKASNAQPSKTKSSMSTSVDTSKLDVKKMSEADFNKLTPRELKMLRGD